MNEGGDKLVTNDGSDSAIRSKTKRSRGRKKQVPFLKVKAGSAVVPIYQPESKGWVRYTLSFYRDGRRERKVFNSLEDAKKEAQFVAQRIQVGMQHVTDLKPHERDSFKAAEAMLQKSGIPLVAAVEDYLRARDLAGTESLAAMVAEYGQHFKKVVRKVDAAAHTITPTSGSTKGITFRAETSPAIFPTNLRYLSAFMATTEMGSTGVTGL
jgi:hypothetical protein